MSEQRILIVEDEQMIAELERDYLEANGFTADIASDGTEGMKKVMIADPQHKSTGASGRSIAGGSQAADIKTAGKSLLRGLFRK